MVVHTILQQTSSISTPGNLFKGRMVETAGRAFLEFKVSNNRKM